MKYGNHLFRWHTLIFCALFSLPVIGCSKQTQDSMKKDVNQAAKEIDNAF